MAFKFNVIMIVERSVKIDFSYNKQAFQTKKAFQRLIGKPF